MPESDYTTEEDMLVDSDDEHQSQHATEASSSQVSVKFMFFGLLCHSS
jgi:hypothetical protein